MSMLFAASHPERVSALVLYGAFARMTQTPDYPWGYPPPVLDRYVEAKVANWGGDETVDFFAPSVAGDPEFRRRFAAFERRATSPGAYRSLMHMNADSDVRDVLASIRVPTLILHRSGDIPIRVGHGRYLSEHIAGARYVELPGDDHFFWVGDTAAIFDEVEEFLTGRRSTYDADRVLCTIVFTDIVDSTRRAADLGDRRWRGLLDDHDAMVRGQLERFRGRPIKYTGDGVFATFDGPARAIRCAGAIRDGARRLGLEIRAGLHTGECEIRDDDLGGIAVHVGARVAGLADPGEVLVSRTVVDLVAGSGIEFTDRGDHQLKGVPGTWRLFAVQA
jgi:class 3 adenylate cyclase